MAGLHSEKFYPSFVTKRISAARQEADPTNGRFPEEDEDIAQE